MKHTKPYIPSLGLTQIQRRVLALPSMLTVLLLLSAIIIDGLLALRTSTVFDPRLYVTGIIGGGYVYVYFYYILPKARAFRKTHLTIAALNGILLGLLTTTIDPRFNQSIYSFTILFVIITAISAGRRSAYALITFYSLFHIAQGFRINKEFFDWAQTISLPIISIVLNETILRLLDALQKQIQNLEIINGIARKIATSLDTKEVVALLNEAIQGALHADSYYVGILNGDHVTLDLFRDEDEYFSDVEIELDGTFTGWVIKNRRSLWVPDSRLPLNLEGVNIAAVGKDKISLSWLGVPMQTDKVIGIIALASYSANAFDKNALELLENLAQQAALAIDNTYQHAEVKRKSRLDSLTGAYNHGYFLELLSALAEDSTTKEKTFSLIMLDVDYFKKYNDQYGHLIGDKVLQLLTDTIRQHIKTTDLIGRWGGEEFGIALPNTTAEQALQVAERIRVTMANMRFTAEGQNEIPAPTVSQGIAVFPTETNEVMKLVDIADKRLYKAKDRGRNQIEKSD